MIKGFSDVQKDYTQQGLFLLDQGDFTGAEEQFTLAIAALPEDAYAYAKRGNARFNLGKYKEAIEDFDKALEYNNQPNKTKCLIDAIVYYDRGLAKYRLGDVPGTMEDMQKAQEQGELRADKVIKAIQGLI